MATFQQRRDPLRLMWRRIGAVALFILVVIAIRGVWGVYMKEKESRLLRVEAEAELSDLQKRQSELQTRIAELKSDRGVEGELRARYNLAGAGESVLVILDPPTQPQQPKKTPLEQFKSFFSW